MSLRTSARTPVRGRGRVVRRGARGGASGWAIGSRVVPATAVPEELVNQVSQLLLCKCSYTQTIKRGFAAFLNTLDVDSARHFNLHVHSYM